MNMRLLRQFTARGIGLFPWGLLSYLPWEAREVALRGIARRGVNQEFLTDIAQRAGISVLGVDGNLGRFQSSSADRYVLMEYALSRDYGANTRTFFNSYFRGAGGTYLDIGANIGMTAVPIARDGKVRCICFEPDPTNFYFLGENIRHNCSGDNVVLHQIALLERSGVVRLKLAADGNLGSHKLWLGEDDESVIEVAGAALDDVVGIAEGPLGIKMDVEGAEPFVILGGRTVMAAADAVAIEFTPWSMTNLSADATVVIEYLAGFDQIAISEPNSKTELSFAPAPQAIRHLRAFEREMANEPGPYLDVYALRVR